MDAAARVNNELFISGLYFDATDIKSMLDFRGFNSLFHMNSFLALLFAIGSNVVLAGIAPGHWICPCIGSMFSKNSSC